MPTYTNKPKVSARGFAQSDRKSGYKNTYYALAELVDNSFDAKSKDVEIIFVETLQRGRNKINEIIVADNGEGMTKEMLEDCLIQGASGVTDENIMHQTKRIGKFGMGLPKASKSITKRVEVYSWQEKNQVYYQYEDLNETLESNNMFVTAAEEKKLPIESLEFYSDIFNENHGTVIFLRNVDLITHTQASTAMQHAEKLLGRIYRYLIHDRTKNIFLSWYQHDQKNQYVQIKRQAMLPNDPLFLMNNSYLAKEIKNYSEDGKIGEAYSQFAISEKEHHPTSYLFENYSGEKTFRYLDKNFKYGIKVSIAHRNIMHPGERSGGVRGIGPNYEAKRDTSQISFVRSGREIDAGDFASSGSFYKASVPENRFWSIEINFDSDMDDFFGVPHTKQTVSFHRVDKDEGYDENDSSLEEAQNHLFWCLTQDIVSAAKEAFKQIKEDGRNWDNEENGNGGLPINTPSTTSTVKITEGKTEEIPEIEKDRIVKTLSEKYPKIDVELIKKSIYQLDGERARAAIIYLPHEAMQLWDYSMVHGVHVIEINSKHNFYENILAPLQRKKDDKNLTAIELFIIALVIEEQQLITNQERKHIIEIFRNKVALKLTDFMANYESSSADDSEEH